MENLFPEVIGQESAKKKLAFYLNSYQSTSIMPNLMLCAPKGQGKSMLAKQACKKLNVIKDGKIVLDEHGKPLLKKAYEINASQINTVPVLLATLQQVAIDKDVTLFIDEAHNISRKVTDMLLTLLNPNPSNKNSFTHDDYTCEIDFTRQTFIFATSESHSVFAPLMDRLTRIDLEDYTLPQLGMIVQKTLPDVEFQEDVLLDIATVLRGNARQAVKMAWDIRSYLCGKKEFNKFNWNDLIKLLSILPLGLSPIELNLLRFMKGNPNGSSLTNLAAKTGLSRDAVQRDYETYLQRHSLMEITAGKGRTITSKGLDYLKNYDYSLNIA